MTRFRMAILALIFLSGAVSLNAQGNSQAALVRSLNDNVLQIHSQLQSAGQGAAAGLRAQGETLLAQRAAAFSVLVQQDPDSALQLAFDGNLAATLGSAFPQAAGQFESHGIWEGPVDYIVFDDVTMMNHRKDIHLLAANGEVLDIYFPNGVEPPGLKCGQILQVEGVRSGNRVAAANGNLNGESVASAGCTSQGTQNVAVILIEFPGVSLPSNVTNSGVYNIFFGESSISVKKYWEEASYGKASAAGDVFGPYVLSQSYSCDDYYAMRSAAIAAADNDAVFTQYTRVFIVFPNPGSCGWAGLGTLGCSTLSSNDGTFTASTSWLLANYMGSVTNGVKLATHEGGHNLTLHHASSRDFGSEALGDLGASGSLSEYGDVFSTMGSWNLGHYAAPHKQQISWFSPGNVETLEANASRTVQPFEILTGGLQALKVRRGAGNNSWLWIEYRKALGDYDATLPSQIFSGATIHYADSTTGTRTHLLDFTPETSSWTDPALAAGKSWVDPYSNVSIQVVSVDANGVTLNTNYGAIPCVRANPPVSLSPSSQSAPPDGNAGFSLSVNNNDSAGCAPTAFQLSSLLPASWSSLFGINPLNISPGGSSGTTMTVYVPSSQPTGSYTVTAKATNMDDSEFFGTKDAGFNVIAAPATSVVVPPGPDPGGAYPSRANVTATATVMSGGSPASGASVNFTLSHPSGASYSGSASTGSNGKADWTYRFKPKDPDGQWTVTAIATWNSMSSNMADDDLWYGYAPTPCSPADHTVVITPSNVTGPAGNTVDYTVTVTNNDTGSCSSSTFNLSSSSAWTNSLNPGSLTLGPGQSGSATMNITVPAGTADGSHPLSATATESSLAVSANATYTVAEVAEVSVTVSVSGGPFAPRDRVPISALVLSNGPAAGASVLFTVVGPDGKSSTYSTTSDASGTASWEYRVHPKGPSGTYSVSAEATYNGGSDSSDTSFLVQ